MNGDPSPETSRYGARIGLVRRSEQRESPQRYEEHDSRDKPGEYRPVKAAVACDRGGQHWLDSRWTIPFRTAIVAMAIAIHPAPSSRLARRTAASSRTIPARLTRTKPSGRMWNGLRLRAYGSRPDSDVLVEDFASIRKIRALSLEP